jgi:hypothetical protein
MVDVATRPRERLARWIVEMQTFQFNVLHEKGDGELMALPDALSRDTFLTRDMMLCNRCLNGVEEFEEILELEAPGNKGDAVTWAGVNRTVITIEEMRREQPTEYGVDIAAGTVLG